MPTSEDIKLHITIIIITMVVLVVSTDGRGFDGSGQDVSTAQDRSEAKT